MSKVLLGALFRVETYLVAIGLSTILVQIQVWIWPSALSFLKVKDYHYTFWKSFNIRKLNTQKPTQMRAQRAWASRVLAKTSTFVGKSSTCWGQKTSIRGSAASMRGPERSSYVAPTVTNNVEWLFQRTRGSIGPKLGEHPVSHFAENFDYFRALKDRQDSFKKAPKRRKNALRRPI